MDDTLRTATNLGTFSDSRKTTFGNVRSPGDINDFFKFQLSETSTLTASLSNLQSDADLHLIKDGNNNGVADSGDVIVNSLRGGTSTDSFTVDGLVSGQYFLRVNKFGSGSTRYTLDVRSTSGLGEEVESEVTDMGNINASRFFRGNLNIPNSTTRRRDTEDIYKFQINSSGDSSFTAALGSGRRGEMELWLDRNGNGVINNDDRLIANSTDNGFITDDNLARGRYLLRVTPRRGVRERFEYTIFAGATPNS